MSNWKANIKKRNKPFYNFDSKRRKNLNVLHAGVKGFLLTCNFKEVECFREGYNILDEYYEKLYSNEVKMETEGDIDKQLEEELSDMRQKREVFHQLATNCRNVVFIESPEEVDPGKVTDRLICDIWTEKCAKTRHLLRFLPVLRTCKASVESIEVTMRQLLAERNESCVDYQIACKVRNNDVIRGLHLIEVIANIVKQEKPQWRVNLTAPTFTINADIICNICCLGILRDFYRNKKYNLVELSHAVINEGKEAPEDVEKQDKNKNARESQISETAVENVTHEKNGNENTQTVESSNSKISDKEAEEKSNDEASQINLNENK